jgi:hypothetical protein
MIPAGATHTGRLHPTPRAFTVVVCNGCTPHLDRSPAEAALSALREVIRHCPHGMLVTVSCLLGASLCSSRTVDGVVAALQPCTTGRNPTSCAHFLGPIRDARDAIELSAWVQEGRWNPGLLPDRLRNPLRSNAIDTSERF